jgi:hypothetical protein
MGLMILKKADMDVQPLREKVEKHLAEIGLLDRWQDAYQKWLNLDQEILDTSTRYLNELGIDDMFGDGSVDRILDIIHDEIMKRLDDLTAELEV